MTMRLLAVLLLAVNLPATCLEAQQAPRKPAIPAAEGYRISGKVVNASSDQVLVDAQVSIYSTGDFRLVQTVNTEQDGRFLFDHVPAGKYMLQGARQGYITSAYEEHDGFNTAIAVRAGLPADDLVLRLTPDAIIHGVVDDDAGEPIRQASVALYRQDARDGHSGVTQVTATNTDDTGSYELPHLRAGTYFLSVTATPWYAAHPSMLAVNPDSNAAPAPRSPLDVVYPTSFYADTTDSDSATPIPVRGGEEMEINFALHAVPGLHLLFHVPEAHPEGAAMPEIRSGVQETGGIVIEQSVFGAITQTPQHEQFIGPGVLEIAGIAPGQYSLRISEGQNRPGRMMTIDASADQQIDSSSGTPTANISGSVSPANQAPTGQPLMIGLTQSGRQTFAPVSGDGSFTFENVAPGSYEVVAMSSGSSLAVERIKATNATVEGHQITVASEQQATLTVTLTEGTASVQGVAKLGGKPAGGAMILLVPANPETSHSLFRRDQSDSDGTFSLTNVVAGTYRVIAIQDGWSLDWAQPAVLAPFLAKGQKVTVSGDAGQTVKLSAPLEVQSREPARAEANPR